MKFLDPAGRQGTRDELFNVLEWRNGLLRSDSLLLPRGLRLLFTWPGKPSVQLHLGIRHCRVSNFQMLILRLCGTNCCRLSWFGGEKLHVYELATNFRHLLICYLLLGNMPTFALCLRLTTWSGWRNRTGSVFLPTYRASTGGSETEGTSQLPRPRGAKPSPLGPMRPEKSAPNSPYNQTYRSV